MDKPAIKIYISNKFDNNVILSEIFSGVEEESVPFEYAYFDNDDAIALSYRAARDSILEVGIGVDSIGNFCIHHKSLFEKSPLFTINYRLDKEKVRSMGSNSARLVKGTPFILS